MPITIKVDQIKYKNNQGEYIGMNGVSEHSTQDELARIEAKGDATIASIPGDYTELWNSAFKQSAEDISVLSTGSNFNTLRTPGQYCVATDSAAAAISNMPVAKAGMLSVTGTSTDSYSKQYFFMAESMRIFVRYYSPGSSTWSAWDEIACKTDIQTGVCRAFGTKVLIPFTFKNGTHNGITYTWNNSVVTANGTAVDTSVNILYNSTLPATLTPGKAYYWNFVSSNEHLISRIIFYNSGNSEISRFLASVSRRFLIPEGTAKINVSVYVGSGYTLNNATANGFIITDNRLESGLSGDDIFAKVDNDYASSDILTLPENGWKYLNGTDMQALLGARFKFTLRSSMGYVITRRRCSDAASIYEVVSMDRTETYLGGSSNADPTNPSWKKVDHSNPSYVDAAITNGRKDDTAVQIYTEFDLDEAGWYWTDGSILPNTISQGLFHTNPIPVKPNTTYYISATWEHSCYGVFFDAFGNFLAPLLDTDITEHVYDIPDKEPDYEGKPVYVYAKLYKFTTPAGAYSFSYNYHNQSTDVDYRQYISSVPVYMHSNTGNLIIKKSDPAYSHFSKRKLCIIGPSYVMIDRLRRTGHFDDYDSTQTQYVVGFQEWLIPFWKEVKSFGYSWATFSNYNVEDGAPKRSIYARIVTDHADISGFDDYIITSNSNDLGANISAGTVTTYTDLGNNTTYIGAVRQIMEYIYQLNPSANIYIATHHHHGSQYRSSTNWQTMMTYNNEIRNLGKIMGCPVIDLETNSGFNQHTATKWHYDYDGTNLYSGVHANHIGNMQLGQCYRKQIVGI